MRSPLTQTLQEPACSASPPNSASHFVPPKDLALYLTRTQVVPRCPLVLPWSTMRFGLQVEYGKLLPYSDRPIIELAQDLLLPAGFINFRPFKGYFDLSFSCKADAAVTVTIPLVFQGVPLPTT
ncbi:hypothetical protein L0F63_003398 [Massospora cicadina]|nr:hypothetical protein L0F63_003398 [Massospora cicadina]